MRRNVSGQTLIIVVAVMVIAVGIGISASSRVAKMIRTTTEADMSSRALAAAEAGVEKFLALPFETLNTYILNNSCGAACQFTITGADNVPADVTVFLSFDGKTSGPYLIDMPKNTDTEVNLQGYPSGSDLQVCVTDTGAMEQLMVLVSFVHGTLGSYQLDNALIETYGCHTIPGQANPVLLRIKSVYMDIEGSVVPAVGAEIPSQGVIIESKAKMNTIERKVRVLKGYNTAPTDFGYTLYQKSETDALSN